MKTECVCINLRRATRSITQLYDRELEPTGIRVTQFSLLSNIARMPGVNLTELADEVCLDRTTLLRNLKVLEKAGLVTITTASGQNGHHVTLTELGRLKRKEARPYWENAQQKVRALLGSPGYENLGPLLEQLQDDPG